MAVKEKSALEGEIPGAIDEVVKIWPDPLELDQTKTEGRKMRTLLHDIWDTLWHRTDPLTRPADPYGARWVIQPDVTIDGQNVTITAGEAEFAGAPVLYAARTFALALSAAGLIRFDGFSADNASNYVLTPGPQGVNPATAKTPAANLFITYVYVSDSALVKPEPTLDLDFSAFEAYTAAPAEVDIMAWQTADKKKKKSTWAQLKTWLQGLFDERYIPVVLQKDIVGEQSTYSLDFQGVAGDHSGYLGFGAYGFYANYRKKMYDQLNALIGDLQQRIEFRNGGNDKGIFTDRIFRTFSASGEEMIVALRAYGSGDPEFHIEYAGTATKESKVYSFLREGFYVDGVLFTGSNAGETHSHLNKLLLDSLVSNGDGTSFLANDGKYHSVGSTGATGGGIHVYGLSALVMDGQNNVAGFENPPFITAGGKRLVGFSHTGTNVNFYQLNGSIHQQHLYSFASAQYGKWCYVDVLNEIWVQQADTSITCFDADTGASKTGRAIIENKAGRMIYLKALQKINLYNGRDNYFINVNNKAEGSQYWRNPSWDNYHTIAMPDGKHILIPEGIGKATLFNAETMTVVWNGRFSAADVQWCAHCTHNRVAFRLSDNTFCWFTTEQIMAGLPTLTAYPNQRIKIRSTQFFDTAIFTGNAWVVCKHSDYFTAYICDADGNFVEDVPMRNTNGLPEKVKMTYDETTKTVYITSYSPIATAIKMR